MDISFLSEEAQQWVEVIIEERGCNVNTVQSGKLKEYGKSGELTLAMVRLILTEEKPKERKVTLKADKISKYFSDSYSNEEIENVISSHLNYVIGCMKNTTTKITNIKAYMVTTLYNAPSTINHYYQQEVQHDMYGGGWHGKGIV